MDQSQSSICILSDLWMDRSFLEFLTYQVKGVFNNSFDCQHNNYRVSTFEDCCDSNLQGCCDCTREFIKHSTFKIYFEKLYKWFKQIKTRQNNNHYDYLFHPLNIIWCFKAIQYYLKIEEIDYFNSRWLDGLFKASTTMNNNITNNITTNNDNNNDNINISIFDIFEILCVHGYLETLQWFYTSEEKNIILDIFYQKRIFFNPNILCNPTILSWLFSLKIFNEINYIHVNIAFQDVCRLGNIEMVKFFLNLQGNRRIDKDVINGDALCWACDYGHVEVVEVLLSLEQDRYINDHDVIERAFILACENGFVKIVELLLALDGDRKIHVNAYSEMFFHMACENGRTEVVKLLLNLKGNRKINVSANNNYAFIVVCELGHVDIIKLLLALDGDRRIDDRELLKKAFMAACEKYHTKVVDLLLRLDGDRKIYNYDEALESIHPHSDITKLLKLKSEMES